MAHNVKELDCPLGECLQSLLDEIVAVNSKISQLCKSDLGVIVNADNRVCESAGGRVAG